MIPYGKQDITQEDIDSVVDVLKSEFITQGPAIPRFEKAISEYCGAEYAVAVNSATSALHVACLALGLGPGDWLWTSPNTFVASANCGLYCGAKVDFVDIDERTYNMSVDALVLKLKTAEQEGKLPKIVVPVHFAGQSCDMKAIKQLADKYGFKIIEDASHAIGGKYLDQPVGNCNYSDITVFSFHPVKIITTAEGGVAVTNDEVLAAIMQRLRTHGITRDAEYMESELEGPWYYQQIELGFNYRMTDMQAALGNSQMQRLDQYVASRHLIQDRYDSLLEDLPVITPWQNPDSYSALHLYPVQIEKNCGIARKQVFDELRNSGIGVNVHYIPVHTQPYYQKAGFRLDDFPVALAYYQQAISLPMFSKLKEEEQLEVVNALRKSLS
ncbi:MAG: UDP-4-amino-4,6-dideoxy-N-acetyl-beta-L-altrosamine transaminase [Gammaproteobacteria bacterium]|nr:UDP-4-amino-4,6-dideoxy-N-acetyl-beta-L-altrosamine transaminase [Gammaproteobacteria bacterium]